MIKKIKTIGVILLVVSIILVGCSAPATNNDSESEAQLEKITLILDWVPNTNHTGFYVAKEKGYFKEMGLDVSIIQPTEGGSADLVAAEQGEFGISYQEQVTYARTADVPLPVKAIAALVQHNTSGFASPASKGIVSPKDFVDKKYGGWGSPMEEAMLKGLMTQYDVDYARLTSVDIGAADFFTATEKDVDFTWIYYGWDGIAAELRNLDINFIKLQDVNPALDFYTPVIITSESVIENRPELVKKFLRATSKGYQFAIDKPAEAVELLLKSAPEIDKKMAIASQEYLAKVYIDDAPRWGEMKLDTWQTFGDWMYQNELMTQPLDAKEAFTNAFLPE